jgi:hypothetical protein
VAPSPRRVQLGQTEGYGPAVVQQPLHAVVHPPAFYRLSFADSGFHLLLRTPRPRLYCCLLSACAMPRRIGQCVTNALAVTRSLPPCHSAGRGNTFWGLYSDSGAALALPGCDFGPYLNFVGRYRGVLVGARPSPPSDLPAPIDFARSATGDGPAGPRSSARPCSGVLGRLC